MNLDLLYNHAISEIERLEQENTALKRQVEQLKELALELSREGHQSGFAEKRIDEIEKQG